MLTYIVFIVASYLFGSLPFVPALARASGLDTSRETDLHIALWYQVSKSKAYLAGFVDFIKGSICVLVAFGFNLPAIVVSLAGVAAVAGQMWPCFPNSHGEKGNTTGVGVIFTLALIYQAYFALLPIIFFAAGAATTYFLAPPQEPAHPKALALPVGMLLGFGVAPIASLYFGEPKEIALGLLALFILIVVRRLTAHLKADLKTGGNVARIMANRFLFDQSFIDNARE